MTTTAEALIEANRGQLREIKGTYLYKAWERVAQALWFVPEAPSAILDVGCNRGAGTALFRIARPMARVDGLECVPERADAARSYCNVVYECFLQDAPFDDASFDVVYAGEVVEHVPYDSVDDFIGTARRILKPKGRLILTTPNPHYLKLWLKGGSVLDDPAHVSVWGPGKLKALVERHGFRVKVIQGTGNVSRKIGTAFPVIPFYGSYMLVADKIG